MIGERHFSTRDRYGEKPNRCCFCSAEEKEKGMKKKTAINGSPKVNVPDDKLVCSFKHDQIKKAKGETARQISPSPSQKRNSSDTDDTQRKSSDTNGKQTRTSAQEGLTNRFVPSLNSESVTKRRHFPECIYDMKGSCNTGKQCAFSFIPKRTLKAKTEGRQEGENPFLFYRHRPSSLSGKTPHAISSS